MHSIYAYIYLLIHALFELLVHTTCILTYSYMTEDDQLLPQVTTILPLLKRGIGIHHGRYMTYVYRAYSSTKCSSLCTHHIHIYTLHIYLSCTYIHTTYSYILNIHHPAYTLPHFNHPICHAPVMYLLPLHAYTVPPTLTPISI